MIRTIGSILVYVLLPLAAEIRRHAAVEKIPIAYGPHFA